jgi:AraC-like DNA-binding protein
MANILRTEKAIGRIVQNGKFCFEAMNNDLNCDECESCDVAGYVNQLSFEKKFFIEDMDFTFFSDTHIKYQANEPFIEILCLDSINAINSEYGKEIHDGIYINLNHGNHGEMRFYNNTPIRGIRIVVKNWFYNEHLIHRFPQEKLDFTFFIKMKYICFLNPELQAVFSQIRNSIRSGENCEIYYESKILELLYLFSKMGNRPTSVLRRLSSSDIDAVEKVKKILEEQYSNAPNISQLAVMTGTSQAKLQNDFKAASGCTIHDYLQAIRMSKALDKVENTETPLYIIAREVGCKNPGRFAEVFKNAYGITPDVYRRNLNG